MRYIQEKYEVREGDAGDDGGTGWVSDRSARTKKGTPGREGLAGGDSASRSMNNAVFYNSIPPGMDIEDQEMADHRVFNESIAGNFPRGHNAGDATQDVNAVSLRKGFDKKKLSPTEEEYTHSHQDVFYEEAEVDDEVGFAERGNTLDRL
jgi:hypothetical protein